MAVIVLKSMAGVKRWLTDQGFKEVPMPNGWTWEHVFLHPKTGQSGYAAAFSAGGAMAGTFTRDDRISRLLRMLNDKNTQVSAPARR